MKQPIITITGPTCSGKSTLQNHLLATGNYTKILGCAGRQPRSGEKDGVDYHFKTNDEIKNLIDTNQMLEWVQYRENYYGISLAEVEGAFASGKRPLVVLEPGGLKHFEDCGYELFTVFLGGFRPELLRRFFSRLNPDPDYNALRCSGMLDELEEWPSAWHYNVRIRSFNANNIEETIKEIEDKYAAKY